MTRKDSEKDSERPHYYSQFWLDVAAGRRIIGTPKTSDESEPVENDIPEPVVPRRSASRSQDDGFRSDGRGETIVHPVAEPTETEEFFEPDEEPDLSNEDIDEQDLAPVDDAELPDVDVRGEEEAPEDEEEPLEQEQEQEQEQEEEEEEEELGWGGRGRKKARPARTTKPPK